MAAGCSVLVGTATSIGTAAALAGLRPEAIPEREEGRGSTAPSGPPVLVEKRQQPLAELGGKLVFPEAARAAHLPR